MAEQGEGPTIFTPHQLRNLEVSQGRRTRERRTRDAMLNPDAHEAKALQRKTKRAQVRGIAEAGLAKLRRAAAEHPEFDKSY